MRLRLWSTRWFSMLTCCRGSETDCLVDLQFATVLLAWLRFGGDIFLFFEPSNCIVVGRLLFWPDIDEFVPAGFPWFGSLLEYIDWSCLIWSVPIYFGIESRLDVTPPECGP